ncbi:sulfotransferase domain-containing protein [Haliangium sp.]|uniref:sulfotransferase domain-containing protein n=1 Tax=Haliangium sp. TaxID=2663208 RepID=UPI003D0EB8E1
MTAPQIAWPTKSREFRNHHFDSTIWNQFEFRDDDIVIATYAKSGTTWMQQIVAQLLFAGAEGLEVARMSPCLEHRVPPQPVKLAQVAAQTHRRFLKTHLAVDVLVFSPKAKYIHIDRDGRDVVWSMYNHHLNANDTWYDTLNNTPGLVGYRMEKPPSCVREYFHAWLEKDGYPFWPFWPHVRSWWGVRHLPNVLSLHYAQLKADMPGEIRRIAKFLDITIDERKWPAIVEHCSFDYMKSNATKSLPFEGKFWDGGAQTFVHKGVNGRWRDILTADEVKAYEERAERELGPACARWLATGELWS